MSAPSAMITDEIVMRVWRALPCGSEPREIRRALESVLPDLLSAAREEGMEEACDMVDKRFCELIINTPDLWSKPANYCSQPARARISSLKPKTTDEARP